MRRLKVGEGLQSRGLDTCTPGPQILPGRLLFPVVCTVPGPLLALQASARVERGGLPAARALCFVTRQFSQFLPSDLSIFH